MIRFPFFRIFIIGARRFLQEAEASSEPNPPPPENPPVWLQQPEAVTNYDTGTNVTLDTLAANAVSYQWEFSANGGVSWTELAGQTNARLTVLSADSAAEGLYRNNASNAFGSVVSDIAQLIENEAPPGDPPIFTVQPAPLTIFDVGDNLTLTSLATDADSYQWEFSDDDGFSWTPIAGQTNADLTINNLQTVNEGQYRNIATNTVGNATSNVSQLTEDREPSWVQQPDPQYVFDVGDNITISTSANDADNYQWEYSDNGGGSWTPLAEQTGPDITINNVQVSDEGLYRNTATNAFGTITSSSGDLVEDQPPVFTLNPQSQTVFDSGDNITLNTLATDADSYQWEYAPDFVTPYSPIPGATGPDLTITNAQTSDQGFYRNTATNVFGTVTSSTALLIENNPPVFTQQPQPSVNFDVGDNVTLNTVASDATSYQWEYSDNGGGTWTPLGGQTGPDLTITNIQTADEGLYRNTATNSFGTVESEVSTVLENAASVVPDIVPDYIPMYAYFEDEFDQSPILDASHQQDFWRTFINTGGSISKASGDLVITAPTYTTGSPTANESTTKYQSRSSFQHNPFVSPIEANIEGWTHEGGVNSTRRYRYVWVPERADEYDGLANPDFYATSAIVFQVKKTGTGQARFWLGFKNGQENQAVLNPALPGNLVPINDLRIDSFTADSYKLRFTKTSYVLTIFRAPGVVEQEFIGAHNLDVANWGRRGDTMVAHENQRDNNTSVDPADAPVTIEKYTAENLLLHETFSNESVLAADVADDFYDRFGNSTAAPNWTAGAGIEFTLDELAGDAQDGYLSPYSKMYNPFVQDYDAKHFFSVEPGADADVRAAWGLSCEAGETPRTAKMAFSVTLDASNTLRFFRKEANDGVGWPEQVGSQIASYTGVGGNIAGFRLEFRHRDTYTLVAILNDAAQTEEAAGSGNHGITLGTNSNTTIYNWGKTAWSSVGDIPNNGDCAVYIGGYRIGGTAPANYVRHRMSTIRRMGYWYAKDQVIGPVGDSTHPEIPQYALDNWSEQSRRSIGLFDNAFAPFNCDPERIDDCTEQWRHWGQFLRYWEKAGTTLPGQYQWDDMIQEIAPLRFRTGDTTADTDDFDTTNYDSPMSWTAGKGSEGQGVEIFLKDGAIGFENAGSKPFYNTRKQMLYVWARSRNNVIAGQSWRSERPNTMMSQNVRGYRMFTGANPGAVCLRLRGAQSTSSINMILDAAGGLCGTDGGPGSGGETVNLTCLNGVHAAWWMNVRDYMGGTSYRQTDEGAQPGPTIHGFTCSGQSDSPIGWSGRGTMILEGVDADVANGVPFIEAKQENQGSAIQKNMVRLRDYDVRWPSANVNNVILRTNRSNKIVRGWVQNCFKLVDYVSLPGGNSPTDSTFPTDNDYYFLERYEEGIDAGPYGLNGVLPSQFRSRRYVDGVPATKSFGFSPVLDSNVPTDLVDKHIPQGVPHMDDADVVTLSLTEDERWGLADSSGKLNTLIAANEKILLPCMYYDDSNQIQCQNDTKLIGVHRECSQFLPRGEKGDYSTGPEKPIINVPDTADGDAIVDFVALHAPVEDQFTTALQTDGKLQLIQISTVLRNSFGYGGNIPNPVNTGLRQIKWIGANAEGASWGVNQGEHWRQKAETRVMYMNGTRKRIEHKGYNGEHNKSNASFEAYDCHNFVISGCKTEGNFRYYRLELCDNFAIDGISGNAQAVPAAHTPNENSLASFGDQRETVTWRTTLGFDASPPYDSPNYNDYPSTAQPIPGGESAKIASMNLIINCTNYEIGMTQGQHQGNGGGSLGGVFGYYSACHRWHLINEDGLNFSKAGYPSDNEADRPVNWIRGNPTVLTQG